MLLKTAKLFKYYFTYYKQGEELWILKICARLLSISKRWHSGPSSCPLVRLVSNELAALGFRFSFLCINFFQEQKCQFYENKAQPILLPLSPWANSDQLSQCAFAIHKWTEVKILIKEQACSAWMCWSFSPSFGTNFP